MHKNPQPPYKFVRGFDFLCLVSGSTRKEVGDDAAEEYDVVCHVHALVTSQPCAGHVTDTMQALVTSHGCASGGHVTDMRWSRHSYALDTWAAALWSHVTRICWSRHSEALALVMSQLKVGHVTDMCWQHRICKVVMSH
eukprot:3934666-Rhodomonas_salina.2